jgi:lysophospholipase L1-like esterase
VKRQVVHLCLNLCLAVASAIGTVALVEGGARWLDLRVHFSLYPSPVNCLQRSRLLSQEFRPRCTGRLAGTVFRTNEAGVRGDKIRTDRAIRILSIGDSCTWGWRVAEEETYPARLQQLLDQRVGAGRYKVINAGVPGYTSYQGLQYLRERGLQLRPAVVVAAYGHNDAATGGDMAEQIAREAKVLPLLQLDDWLLDNSRAYKWARWHVWYRQGPSLQLRVAATKYEDNLRHIATLARDHGSAILFIGFRAPPTHGAAYAKVAEELTVPLIRYEGPLMDEVHPTAEGYRSLAVQIYERLAGDGLL